MQLANKVTMVLSRKILSRGNTQHYLENVNMSGNVEDICSYTLMTNLYSLTASR